MVARLRLKLVLQTLQPELLHSFFSDQQTLTIANLTDITEVQLTASISKNVAVKKTKSLQKMFIFKVNKTIQDNEKQLYGLTNSHIYGNRIEDRDLSLGLVDAQTLTCCL